MKPRWEQYAQDVEAGRILTCEATRKAVARYRSDLVRARKRRARWRFDPASAQRIIDFAEALEQWEEPFAGEYITLQPWECFFLAQLYGWLDRKTGKRRFKKTLLFVTRKQGKTILASVISLYEILTKEGIEAYSLATKQEIADKVLKNLKAFVARSEDLQDLLKVYTYSVVNRTNMSVFKPLSRDSSLDGLNPSVSIVDELAAQKSSSAYHALTSGMGTRSEPLTVIISTAGYGNQNPLIEEYEYGKKILDGSIEDDSYLVIMYELEPEDRWDDLAVMGKCSPNLGVSVPLSYYEKELRQAKAIPRFAAEYKVKYCNLWQSSIETWIPDATWARCRKAAEKHVKKIAPEELEEAPSIIALDFSTIWDWTAMSRYTWIDSVGKYLARHRFYIPKDKLEEKATLENPALRDWVERGLVTATPGEQIDHRALYSDLEAELLEGRVLAIVYDPARAKDFEAEFQARATIVPFSQKTANMSPAAKGWESAIVKSEIMDDSPVLRWMVSCAINKQFADTGRYLITKSGSGKYGKRIDGVYTSMMAHAVLRSHVLELQKPKPKVMDLSQIRY